MFAYQLSGSKISSSEQYTLDKDFWIGNSWNWERERNEMESMPMKSVQVSFTRYLGWVDI